MVFTFGFGHCCACGRTLANCYTVLEGDDALETMFRVWGPCWAHFYGSEEAAGVVQFHLERIETNTSDERRCPCGAQLLAGDAAAPQPSHG